MWRRKPSHQPTNDMTSWLSRLLSEPEQESPAPQSGDAATQDGIGMVPEHMVMFATGIECSYPVILNGTHRVDELALTGHYERWREDLALVREMGLKFLRYGFPYHLVNP